MSRLVTILLFVFVLALVIVVVSIIAYNRHLDQVTRGEARGTHSTIPEPGTTISGVYRIVLMVVIVISFLMISAMNGRMAAMKDRINDLQRSQNYISDQLDEIREELHARDKRIASSSIEFLGINSADQTAKVRYSVDLKEYTEDTQVKLILNQKEIPLEREIAGMFKGTFDTDMFTRYDNPEISITEAGRTLVEETDFPGELAWELFPLPSITGNSLESSGSAGRITSYKGSFTLMADGYEEIESAALTYMTGGKDLKTVDITREIKDETEVPLEQGLKLEGDLTFRIDITTRSGYRIIQQTVMIYDEEIDISEIDYTEIQDAAGNTLWKTQVDQ